MSTYRKYGQKKGLSPWIYVSKLLNFSSNGVSVNLIRGKYYRHLCANVVSSVGFGPGPLKKITTHRATFILTPNDSGILYFFRYEDVERFLTFDWFKLNIICAEQEWICANFDSLINLDEFAEHLFPDLNDET
ncbi:uncharacterized protein LOC142338230 [Convolutriloba macropyga]|uniref:uncharacterized protein LOC142338230 n=1 Tax=Convolutriloba macropyga TaxID=536237 RepID=UPI003F5207D0